jgi:hypothetical protein
MGMTLENMSISEFLRRPYLQQDSNTAIIAKNNYTNPVQMWNDKTRAFLAVTKPKVILRQEELFDVESLQRKLPSLIEQGFTMGSGKVSFPPMNEEKSIRGEEVNSPLEYKFTQKGLDVAKAKAITPASAFSPEDLKFIQSELDPEVLDAVGYGSILQD